MDKKIVSLGRAPAAPVKKRKCVGVGVAIWASQPFAFVVSGNKSGLAPVQEVFREIFGGA